MTTFKAIDQDAAASDLPYHTALAQGIRTNVIASVEKRLRSQTHSYPELYNRPRMVGTYHYTTDNKIVHTMIPFIYVRSRPDVTEIDVAIAGVQTGATGTVTAVVVTMTDALSGAFPGLDDMDSMPNTATSGVTASASVQEVLFSGADPLVLPPYTGDTFVVFICSRSALIGTRVEILDNLGAAAVKIPWTGALHLAIGACVIEYTSDIPHDETTQRADFAVQMTPATGKTDGWPTNGVPSSRQAIYVDDAGSSTFVGIYVYPPFELTRDYPTVDTTGALYSNHFSTFDLVSVTITESAVNTYAQNSALNGGKPLSVEPQHVVINEAEKQALRATPCFHMGGTVAIDTNDLLLTAVGDGAANRLHNSVVYDGSAWTTIGNCLVRPHGEHARIGSTQETRCAYRVVGILALSAHAGIRVSGPGLRHISDAPTYGLDVQLILSDVGDVTGNAVTSPTFSLGRVLSNAWPVGHQHDQKRDAYPPVGYLLRAHHMTDVGGGSTDSQKPNDLLSHALLGQFPEDVWAGGSYVVFDEIIVETSITGDANLSVPARLLTIQVQGVTADEPPASDDGDTANTIVHLLTWTCVGMAPPTSGTVGEYAI
jgi:hypothetical protein